MNKRSLNLRESIDIEKLGDLQSRRLKLEARHNRELLLQHLSTNGGHYTSLMMQPASSVSAQNNSGELTIGELQNLFMSFDCMKVMYTGTHYETPEQKALVEKCFGTKAVMVLI